MSAEPPFTRRSLARKLSLSLGGLLLLSSIGLLSAPSLLSTKRGTEWLCKQILKHSGCHVHIDALSLSWIGPQNIEDLTLQDAQGQLHCDCPQVTLSAPLWQILLSHSWGALEIKSPSLTLSTPFKPSAQLKSRPLDSAGLLPSVKMGLLLHPSQLRGHITIDDGCIRFEAPDIEPMEFDHIQAKLHLDDNALQGSLSGLSSHQGTQGTLSLEGTLSSLSAQPRYAVHAHIKDLPTQGLDQLVSLLYPDYAGILYQSIGSSLTLDGSLNTQAASADLHLDILSPLIQASFSASTAEGTLTLSDPAHLRWQITPLLLKTLARSLPALRSFSLQDATTLEATLSQWNSPFPLNDAADLSPLSFAFNGSLSPQTTVLYQDTPLVLDTFSLEGHSSSLKEELSWNASAQLQAPEGKGTLSSEGHLTQPLSPERQGTLSFKTQHCPLSPLQAWGWDAVATLGSQLDLDLALDLNTTAPQLTAALHTPTLTLSPLTLSLKDIWTLTAPVTFTYQPTLFSSTPIEGVIQRFTLPPQHWEQLQLDLLLNVEQFTLGQVHSHTHLSLLVQTLDKLSLNMQSDTLTASAVGKYQPATATLSLLQPLTVQYLLDLPQLASKAHLQGTIDPFSYSFTDPLHQSFKGQLFCPEAALNTIGQPLLLQNILLPFQWNGKNQNLNLQFSSQTKTGGTLQGQLLCLPSTKGDPLDLKTASIQGSLSLHHISSELIDALTQQSSISALIGPTFDADLSLKSAPAAHTLSLKWTSPLLTCESSFNIDSTGLRLQSPCTATWILTPDSYRSLDRLITEERQPLFGLNDTSSFTVALSHLFLPVQPPTTDHPLPTPLFDLTQLECDARISNSRLAFSDKSSKETISLSDIQAAFHKTRGEAPFSCTLNSSVSTQNGPSAKAGSLTCSATIVPPKQHNFSLLDASIQLQAKQFPTRAIDLFARAFGRTDLPFTTLLGPTLHLSLDTQLHECSGPIQFNLNTPTTQAELSGHLINGALILDKPLFAQFLVSKESSRLFLNEVNPLDLSYIYSQTPVTLHIPQDGFFLPLHPWIPEKVTIPDASLELGRISCRNEGNVNIALGLLKAQQFNKNQDLTLWFAPLDFSIKQGLVAVDRTEILISDLFDVCLWGQVDLVKEYVDMVFGLTAQTLTQAFGIQGLPENYILTIPMKGKMDNVQINAGKATAKVALLLAWQQRGLAGSVGGPAGAIAGELLGALATLPDAKVKAPPPKHPFPWETDPQTPARPHSKRKIFKTNDKPLKQILKVIR